MAANPAGREVKALSSKRRIAVAAVAILLILFLVRPGVSRLKLRIANSIGQALARPVAIGSVQLRFLPRPGFDLENVIVYEDPAFGAEPMLRAAEVTAVVRLTSLVRGRLDISRLELTEPSLNLVRREDGRWNLEALLERSEHTPLAPTAKSKGEARPGFPYIQGSSGRINFKTGPEKRPYALLNADFALWQESENEWGVRLKGEPLRTDMSLSDTGLLRVDGTWHRAGSLRETPLEFTVAWDHAQLGQLSKLLSGNDQGWRGDVQMETTLSGTPGAMQLVSDTAIHDFHRYDILTNEGPGLAAHCEAKYSSGEGMMREIFCSAPVGNGMITLHGESGKPGLRGLDLALNLENVPASSVAQLARRVKKDLPPDIVAGGSVQGNFEIKESGALPRGPEFRGQGEIVNLRLQSANSKAELAPGNVPFTLNSDQSSNPDPLQHVRFRHSDVEVLPASGEMRIEFGPVPLALGRPLPAQARGWLGRSGYGIAVRGDGDVSHTLRMASLLGLQALKSGAEGAVKMDLQVAGSWSGNAAGNSPGFALPKITGTVQLRNVHANLRGTNGAIEISSAELSLLPDEARVEKLRVRAADAEWTGSMILPRGCGTPGTCLVHFNLNTDAVGLSGLHGWLGSQPSERRWYQVLTPAASNVPSFLQSLRASGKVSVGRLWIHDLVAEQVSAGLDLDHGKLKISDLRADLLGGKHRGDWRADYTAASPVYTGSGTLTEISLEQMASAMHDPWISGTGGGTYQITASGRTSAEFWQSAVANLSFDLRDGIMSHIALANDDGPLRIGRWRGGAQLRDGTIEIEKSALISSATVYEVNGTASLGQSLDFKLIPGTEAKSAAGSLVYSVTGTLSEPHVAVNPTPETQARLKP
ncbi:MAG TPA: AsmA family protein [Candidatus Deferrimicrobiaceae bacterium]|nr:AsmA family protein [Candidatus Deferrimicrobiaceae bacterium]